MKREACFFYFLANIFFMPILYGHNIGNSYMDEKIQSVVLDENKGLSEQLNCPNIKYIITTEIFLSKGELINIPENSILKFEGGSIEGNGTIIGNKINADCEQV